MCPEGRPRFIVRMHSELRRTLDRFGLGSLEQSSYLVYVVDASLRLSFVWRHVPQLLEEVPLDTTHGLCEPCLGFYLGTANAGAER